MDSHRVTVRGTHEADWERVRDLRLEMIADTPIAYGESLETARSHDEELWRSRARRGAGPHDISVVAVNDATGDWVGTMSGYIDPGTGGPLLVGVYVGAAFRGRASGVTDALLTHVEDWARSQDGSLTLHVHEDNTRAIAAYLRRGFESTGQSFPYELDTSRLELEMRKPL